jgi:putative transposase
MKNLDGLPQGVIRQHFALKRHVLRASLYRKQLAARFDA